MYSFCLASIKFNVWNSLILCVVLVCTFLLLYFNVKLHTWPFSKITIQSKGNTPFCKIPRLSWHQYERNQNAVMPTALWVGSIWRHSSNPFPVCQKDPPSTHFPSLWVYNRDGYTQQLKGPSYGSLTRRIWASMVEKNPKEAPETAPWPLVPAWEVLPIHHPP